MMAFEEWKKIRREKQLERINKELEELREKGPMFAKKADQKKFGDKDNASHSGGANAALIVIIVVLAIGWAATFVTHLLKVDTLNDDITNLNEKISTKTDEVAGLQTQVENLTKLVDGYTKSGDELNQELEDLDIVNQELDDEMKVLKSESATLKLNVTIQGSLISGYKNCITDDDGVINKSLSVCDKYL